MTIKEYEIKKKKEEKLENFKENMIKELKEMHHIIDDTKCNHLILADNSEYHHKRYIVEKEKLDLLEEIIEMIYNYK